MRVAKLVWKMDAGWQTAGEDLNKVDLVLYFGSRSDLAAACHASLRARFPDAILMGCSTGGQISGDDIADLGIHGLAISMEKTRLAVESASCGAGAACSDVGAALAARLMQHSDENGRLAGVFILSDGLKVNGSQLVAGMIQTLGRDIPIMGGLAGDGADFSQTLVAANAPPVSGVIAALGFYGDELRIGHGSAGGWDVFGPRRRVTRSAGNVLFELDGEPALDLYKRYLGDEAAGLPGSALLFPLMLRDPARPDHEVVRTILAVDHEANSLTFAGDIPEGWTAQLMRGNFDRLSQGAAAAAREARNGFASSGNGLAVMISCIGRRLLMGQRITDEIEAAMRELPAGTPAIGFYSYGEISPHAASGYCELHNQTMTVMTLAEVA